MATEVKQSEWEGMARLDFTFNGRECILIRPKQRSDKSDSGKMVMYMEYFGAFPNTAISLVEQGYHLSYIKNSNRWGTDDDQHMRRDFVDFLAEEYGLSRRFVTIGMSAGGVTSVNFAYLYPDYVSVLYLDAPAMNLLSAPLGYNKPARNEEVVKEVLDALGLTESEMLSFRGHPMDKMGTLVERNIPVVLVYGDSDSIVPYEENGKLLADFYEKHGKSDIISVFGKEGCEHHPHGLPDPKPIVDFILKHDK
ncbi:alpha/beta fold hydrolase [Paenibacillus albus]|uniref:Alpha/beta hydrolase n=1 Tax=Paenibacillus albus TaxID=2495582 RepID=A0A3S9AA02_9BACL|nr:alpha/beta hydrolase [Paenibacillus albus]AZN42617.1 alpha/beta hydrolase [Paenibacillus albus]